MSTTASRSPGSSRSASISAWYDGAGEAVEDEAPGPGVGLGRGAAATISMMQLVAGTSSPCVHVVSRLEPEGGPVFTAARSMSPVEMCGTT